MRARTSSRGLASMLFVRAALRQTRQRCEREEGWKEGGKDGWKGTPSMPEAVRGAPLPPLPSNANSSPFVQLSSLFGARCAMRTDGSKEVLSKTEFGRCRIRSQRLLSFVNLLGVNDEFHKMTPKFHHHFPGGNKLMSPLTNLACSYD